MAARLKRRQLIASAAAASLVASAGWASAGAPRYLAATRDAAGGHTLLGLGADGAAHFAVALPDRGHAAAAHPARAEAVAFARRPGRFAVVLDCRTGSELKRLHAPEGRHFYGHGTFSADGGLLYTTENAVESGDGRIGVWDAGDGYRRIGDLSTGGIGPHDLRLLADGRTLAIANGGIRTHPASGREKLNLDSMAPSLAYMSASDGVLLELVSPPAALRLNSIRHLAVGADGTVAVALQWQGDPGDGVPLLAFHRQGQPELRFAEAAPHQLAAMAGYAGSVAFSGDGRRAAITSPRGGRVMAWDITGGEPRIWSRQDVCGLAPAETGWIATDGLGGIIALSGQLAPRILDRRRASFDNHLVALEG